MSRFQHPEVPRFYKHQEAVTEGKQQILGLRENWLAPIAFFDLKGFGEETWIDAIPETLLACRLSGAEVRRARGVCEGASTRTGKWTLQPAGTPNSYCANGPVRFAQIYLPHNLIDKVATDLTGRPTAVSARLRDDVIFEHDPELQSRIEGYVKGARSAATQVKMECRAILLIERLLTRFHGFGGPTVPPRHAGLAQWQLKRVEELLRADLARNIALEDLGREARLSASHFSRAFKASTGVPPYRYLIQLRIGRAKELLEHTTLPVTEIAAQVGYDDPGYFARLFVKEVGVTPSLFRRERRS